MRTYSMIYHDFPDSPMGHTLSTGAFRVWFDFSRAWAYESGNNQRSIESLPLVWSLCAWTVHEKAWNGYRRELEAAGAIEAVNRKTGLYRPSEAWQTRTPDEQSTGKLEHVAAARSARAARVRDYRNTITNPAYKISLRTPNPVMNCARSENSCAVKSTAHKKSPDTACAVKSTARVQSKAPHVCSQFRGDLNTYYDMTDQNADADADAEGGMGGDFSASAISSSDFSASESANPECVRLEFSKGGKGEYSDFDNAKLDLLCFGDFPIKEGKLNRFYRETAPLLCVPRLGLQFLEGIPESHPQGLSAREHLGRLQAATEIAAALGLHSHVERTSIEMALVQTANANWAERACSEIFTELQENPTMPREQVLKRFCFRATTSPEERAQRIQNGHRPAA